MFRSGEEFVGQKIEERVGYQKKIEAEKKMRKGLDVKFKTLEALAAKRTRWLEMVEAIRACMKDGMFLTSIRPISADGMNVTDIEISGRGFVDKFKDVPNEPSQVDQLREKLIAGECFTENTKITHQPVVQPSDYLRDFRILVNLRTPVSITDDRKNDGSKD